MEKRSGPEATVHVIMEQIKQLRIVPVIVIDDASDAVPLAAALADGGLPCAEVTVRTSAAEEAIRRMTGERPDLLVGAGTVLTPLQAQQALAAGATFIVAPGFNPAVVDYCQEREVPVFPGVCTPTEIEMALNKGLTVVKFFPAEAMGGLNTLKAIAAPYGMIEFIPTGGISSRNIRDYLAFQRVVACGGSWMAPAEWIREQMFDRIRTETQQAVEAAR
jgi:2-dehydro-3-deoxyphosphogluconate aldolase / (4S)-4-hydroxy-2-oxoglutarate aldolase